MAKACGKHSRNVRSRLTRIHPDQHAGCWAGFLQIVPQRAPSRVKRGVIQRRRSRHASNSISSKEFFWHLVEAILKKDRERPTAGEWPALSLTRAPKRICQGALQGTY